MNIRNPFRFGLNASHSTTNIINTKKIAAIGGNYLRRLKTAAAATSALAKEATTKTITAAKQGTSKATDAIDTGITKAKKTIGAGALSIAEFCEK